MAFQNPAGGKRPPGTKIVGGFEHEKAYGITISDNTCLAYRIVWRQCSPVSAEFN